MDGYTDLIWIKDKDENDSNSSRNKKAGAENTEAEILNPKRVYILKMRSSEIDGTEIYDGENYPSFPIIPLWGNPHHQSELVGLREQIDCYDLYMRRFQVKDDLKRQAVQNGQITMNEYKQWRLGQISIGKRWGEMRESIAKDLTNTAQIAKSVAYGYMSEVYALNHDYGTFQIEQLSGIDTSYTLYDRQTVEHLFKTFI